MKLGHNLFVSLVLCLAMAGPAVAQVRATAWGVTATFTPLWEVSDYQKPLYDVDEVDISGREFTIGFVRGRSFGGHWGLSYQQRPVEDGSFTKKTTSSGTVTRTFADEATLRGAELRGFIPFTTIKERAQIGVTWGFGAAEWRGTFVEQTGSAAPVPLPNQGLLKLVTDRKYTPTGRLELTGAVILSPNVKATIGAGINLPGTNFISLGVVYLFGGG